MPDQFKQLLSRLTMLKPMELLPQASTQTMFQRISGYAVVRLILAALFIAPVIAAGNILSIFVLDRVSGTANLILEAIRGILVIGFVLVMYRLYCRKIEHRQAKEISFPYSIQEWSWGYTISLVMMMVMLVTLVAGGMYHVAGISHCSVLIRACTTFIVGAFLQELIFRVLLFKIIEEYLGTWRTILVIAAVFALMHLGNEHSSYISTGSLFVSDFLLSAIFILTRRMWMVWGMHAGWNLLQDGILGMPNSGIDSFPSLLKPILKGPGWLTGGNFGLESSLMSVLLNLILAGLILKLAYNHQQMLLPKWKRK